MQSVEINAFTKQYSFSTLVKVPGMKKGQINVLFSTGGPRFPYNYSDCHPQCWDFHNQNKKSNSLPSMESFSVRGGIMADEMGLGKTISMIALILSNTRKEITINTKTKEKKLEINHTGKDAVLFESKSTLIVCAPHLVAQWEKEIKTKTNLKVKKISTFANLKKCTYSDLLHNDAIIVSYTLLTKSKPYLASYENKSVDMNDISESSSSPVLHFIGWHRIITDEAHEMDQRTIDLFTSKFYSNFRWYVTGTPFPHKDESFRRACSFIDLKLKSKLKISALGNDSASKYYQYLLWNAFKKSVYWKNTKFDVESQTDIPPLTENVNYITLSPIEKALYDAAELEENSKHLQREICSNPLGSSLIGGFLASKLYELPPILVQNETDTLRNTINEIERTNNQIRVNEKDLQQAKKYDRGIVELERKARQLNKRSSKLSQCLIKNICCLSIYSRLLPTSNKSPCDICNNSIINPCTTSCSHKFCSHCITKFVNENKSCPTCHTSISISNLSFDSEINRYYKSSESEKLPEELKDASPIDIISATYGSKIAAVADYLLWVVKDKDVIRKVIVFSQYDKILDSLRDALIRIDENIFNNQMITCKGNIHVRNKKIASFNSMEPDSPRILMLSLLNAASGTQLEVASHVILLDPVVGSREEARAIDAQAIARSHRLGQSSTVEAVRFIAMCSVEQEDYENAYGKRSRQKSARK